MNNSNCNLPLQEPGAQPQAGLFEQLSTISQTPDAQEQVPY